MEIKTVGFVGVGTMGRGMVNNLAKNGFKVIAYNRTKEKIRDIESDRVTVADSLEETSKADLVMTCLPSDDIIEEIAFKKNILDKLKGKVFVDCGTTSVDMTARIAEACEKKNVEFIDAPITGSKLGAEAGTMTMMIGGKKDVFEKCMPVLKAMGKVHVYCGPATYGQRAKLALNLAMSMLLESYLECLVFAVKNGVPLSAMEQIMENSAAKNGIGSFKMNYIRKRDFEQHFMLKLMHKDLSFAEREMKKLNLDLPLAKHIKGIFEKSMERGDEDMSTIVKELEKKAGVELKGS
ncbi:NAD(P)-dependent oxidoreductase [Candidatus Woesearchaeota archaeon]|nr:NAD(P)-dependent oxidoreductase [Candidatus Woesearchaeota archaeon]